MERLKNIKFNYLYLKETIVERLKEYTERLLNRLGYQKISTKSCCDLADFRVIELDRDIKRYNCSIRINRREFNAFREDNVEDFYKDRLIHQIIKDICTDEGIVDIRKEIDYVTGDLILIGEIKIVK